MSVPQVIIDGIATAKQHAVDLSSELDALYQLAATWQDAPPVDAAPVAAEPVTDAVAPDAEQPALDGTAADTAETPAEALAVAETPVIADGEPGGVGGPDPSVMPVS